ncbi:unnamed protein product [Boreogadus saida]
MSTLSLGQQVSPKWELPWKTRDLGKQPAGQPVQGHQNQLVIWSSTRGLSLHTPSVGPVLESMSANVFRTPGIWAALKEIRSLLKKGRNLQPEDLPSGTDGRVGDPNAPVFRRLESGTGACSHREELSWPMETLTASPSCPLGLGEAIPFVWEGSQTLSAEKMKHELTRFVW